MKANATPRPEHAIPKTKEFFDKATFTLTYVVWDPATRETAVIDPVLDYDPASSTVSLESVSKVRVFLEGHSLQLRYLLETHAHADHLSGSQALKKLYPDARIAIGAGIVEVQKAFKPVFGMPEDFRTDGSQFDLLLKDGETLPLGSLAIRTLSTPGHTPACVAYHIGDAVFTGDALFMPDSGVGRCDFPAGSAEALYDSVTRKLYGLPEQTRVFTGHDYQPGGRALRFESTIGEEKRSNVHLSGSTSKEAFVKFRSERDRTLGSPKLQLPSIQINIDAGHLPPPRRDGRRYLNIPISEAKAD